MISEQDLAQITTASLMQGVSNNQRAAIARGTLALLGAMDGAAPSAPADGNKLELRVAALEKAVQGLPDAEALEGGLDGLASRLDRIEKALGLGEGALEVKAPAKPKRR